MVLILRPIGLIGERRINQMTKRKKDKPENVMTVDEFELAKEALLPFDQGIAVVIKCRAKRENSEDYPYFYQRLIGKFRSKTDRTNPSPKEEFTKAEQKLLFKKIINLFEMLEEEE
jgi:hypothetical protein